MNDRNAKDHPVAVPNSVHHAGFWLRFAAAILDFLFLAVAVAVVVSFYSVFTGHSLDFLSLHPGETPLEVLQAFGASFVHVLVLIFILGSWLYFALSESSSPQASLGKRIFGLQVTDRESHRLSFARATLRFCTGRLLAHIPVVGTYYFLADCLFAAVPPQKQAFHDRIAQTFVLRITK